MSIWPIHPPPQDDELLSSWMVRLAHGNCYKVHDFYCQHFGRERNIWNRDIDHFSPDWLLDGLSKHTGLSVEQLNRLTLKSLEGVVFTQFNQTTSTRGLLSLGVYHRTRKVLGQQFCPLCLLEDAAPYLRKKWRVAYITTCDRHKIILHDKCEHCSMPMMPHRADMSSRYCFPMNIGIDYCASCGKRFTRDQVVKAQPEPMSLQLLIHQAIYDGYVNFPSENLYSFIFLEGLRVLAHGYSRENHLRIREGKNKIGIETSGIELRHELICACAELLRNWPDNFARFIANKKHPYTQFVSKNGSASVPNWVESAILTNL
ncbi:MAG: TniQ family protein [Sideroxyarcus sp.]|nr:TniQ family protein [Sideroxyarcus sp.]